MNRQRQAFVVLLTVAVVVSTAAAFPLTNTLRGNPDGWFTINNLDEYGEDLDARANSDVVVFTGHPSYVIASEQARLLFDMPRIHYFASTFNDTEVGDDFYRRLIRALRTGRADLAIAGPMTEAIIENNSTAETAFATNYCRVADAETQWLYNRTHSTIFAYEPDCPAARQPAVENLSDES
jgi:hypothetical protein